MFNNILFSNFLAEVSIVFIVTNTIIVFRVDRVCICTPCTELVPTFRSRCREPSSGRELSWVDLSLFSIYFLPFFIFIRLVTNQLYMFLLFFNSDFTNFIYNCYHTISENWVQISNSFKTQTVNCITCWGNVYCSYYYSCY